MWPIARFLYELTGAADRRELAGIIVDRLVPVNRSKAFRRVYALIDDGRFDESMAARLEGGFPERAAGLREALAATESQRAAREEAAATSACRRRRPLFRPHLWIATQRDRPSQINILAVTGGIDRWLKVWLPKSIDREPWRTQQKLVRAAVRDHRRHDRHGGQVPFFGIVVGYWYRPRLESRFWVSVDGIVHNHDYGPFEEPRAHNRGAPPSLVG
jgi:hypothetical protein